MPAMTDRAEAWRGRRVLVTGCNGFLGSWVTAQLVEAGAQVVGLIRDTLPESQLVLGGTIGRITVVDGELEDYRLMERTFNEFEIDSCFHLAAQAIVPTASRLPLSTFESNIRGTYNVLEAARRYGRIGRFVLASSDKVYGTKERLPYVENDPLMGQHPYDVSKVCADLLTQSYAHQYDLPIGIARCGNFYGPGDLNFSRIVPGTIRSLLRNERPVIRSNGKFLRDYFYVEDAAGAFVALGAALDDAELHGEAFNFGTETPTSVTDVVEALIKLSGKTSLEPVILNEAHDEIFAQWLSCDKARSALGWQFKTPLSAGLGKAYAWYEQVWSRTDGSRSAVEHG
jgi:CDP-glucose 4,6-dehydratase